jgi:hypothetical protein
MYQRQKINNYTRKGTRESSRESSREKHTYIGMLVYFREFHSVVITELARFLTAIPEKDNTPHEQSDHESNEKHCQQDRDQDRAHGERQKVQRLIGQRRHDQQVEEYGTPHAQQREGQPW